MWTTQYDILETVWMAAFFTVVILGVTGGIMSGYGMRRSWEARANPSNEMSTSQMFGLAVWWFAVILIMYANQEYLNVWLKTFIAQASGQTAVTEGTVKNYVATLRSGSRHRSVTETFAIGRQTFQLDNATTIPLNTLPATRDGSVTTYLVTTGRGGVLRRSGMHAKVWHDGSHVARFEVRK